MGGCPLSVGRLSMALLVVHGMTSGWPQPRSLGWGLLQPYGVVPNYRV